MFMDIPRIKNIFKIFMNIARIKNNIKVFTNIPRNVFWIPNFEDCFHPFSMDNGEYKKICVKHSFENFVSHKYQEIQCVRPGYVPLLMTCHVS